MSKKVYDACVVTHEKDGKKHWERVGSVFENDKGHFMLLKKHFNPAAISGNSDSDSIMISFFEPKQKD